ncbi:MAG: hypothetical protein KIH89_002420 [Candidatus Shapirobacteria bacterium]|nr:hypothetical protein [Candidatus Shapirobacteria bacterium]
MAEPNNEANEAARSAAESAAKPEVDLNMMAYNEGARRLAARDVCNAYRVQNDLMMPGVTADDGKEIVSHWVYDQLSPNGTELNAWTEQPIFDALATRRTENRAIRQTRIEINTLLSGLIANVTSGADPVLESAIAKQAVEKIAFNNEWQRMTDQERKERSGKEAPLSKLMTTSEMLKYVGYQDKIKRITAKVALMGGEMAELEGQSVKDQLAVAERTVLRDKHIDYLNVLVTRSAETGGDKSKGKAKKPVTLESLKTDLEQEIGIYADEEEHLKNQLNVRLGLMNVIDYPNKSREYLEKDRFDELWKADFADSESDKDGESDKWASLELALVSINQILGGCKQMLQNASDLEPLSHLWEGQGRMVDFNPGLMGELMRQLPSFAESFRAICAISSGKYALATNGEIYISGAYGLGYVETATNRLVDVDEARKMGSGVEKLERDEIWVNGQKVKLSSTSEGHRIGYDENGNAKNVIAEGMFKINGEDVRVYMENLLYDGGVTDAKIAKFSDILTDFVKAKDPSIGGFGLDLGVALAKDFFEMSMLSCWFGMPRDSKGNLYYVEYDGIMDYEKIFSKSTPMPDYKKRFSAISSDPKSMAFKSGTVLCGTDESTYNPSFVIDYGKLLMTRNKQVSEMVKGRKHGFNPLIPYMPESLMAPMIDGQLIGKLIDQGRSNGSSREILTEYFDKSKSIMKKKNFMLSMARGIAVYETISQPFVGEKDVLASGKEMLNLLRQPGYWEKINKAIDLSLLYVDPIEAARLKVNLVTISLAAVAQEFRGEDFVGIAPKWLMNQETRFSKPLLNVNLKQLRGMDTGDDVVVALKQLVSSRIIGDETHVMKVIEKLNEFSENKSGVGFFPDEFESKFGGTSYLNELAASRENRKQRIYGNARVKARK